MKNIALSLSPELSTKVRALSKIPGLNRADILAQLGKAVEDFNLDGWAKEASQEHLDSYWTQPDPEGPRY